MCMIVTHSYTQQSPQLYNPRNFVDDVCVHKIAKYSEIVFEVFYIAFPVVNWLIFVQDICIYNFKA